MKKKSKAPQGQRDIQKYLGTSKTDENGNNGDDCERQREPVEPGQGITDSVEMTRHGNDGAGNNFERQHEQDNEENRDGAETEVANPITRVKSCEYRRMQSQTIIVSGFRKEWGINRRLEVLEGIGRRRNWKVSQKTVETLRTDHWSLFEDVYGNGIVMVELDEYTPHNVRTAELRYDLDECTVVRLYVTYLSDEESWSSTQGCKILGYMKGIGGSFDTVNLYLSRISSWFTFGAGLAPILVMTKMKIPTRIGEGKADGVAVVPVAYVLGSEDMEGNSKIREMVDSGDKRKKGIDLGGLHVEFFKKAEDILDKTEGTKLTAERIVYRIEGMGGVSASKLVEILEHSGVHAGDIDCVTTTVDREVDGRDHGTVFWVMMTKDCKMPEAEALRGRCPGSYAVRVERVRGFPNVLMERAFLLKGKERVGQMKDIFMAKTAGRQWQEGHYTVMNWGQETSGTLDAGHCTVKNWGQAAAGKLDAEAVEDITVELRSQVCAEMQKMMATLKEELKAMKTKMIDEIRGALMADVKKAVKMELLGEVMKETKGMVKDEVKKAVLEAIRSDEMQIMQADMATAVRENVIEFMTNKCYVIAKEQNMHLEKRVDEVLEKMSDRMESLLEKLMKTEGVLTTVKGSNVSRKKT
jgi:uncharacterized coiled-coil protein SlyX